MTNQTNGRKPPPKAELDRLVTFCFDRFDMLDGITNCCSDLPEKERKLNQRRMQRWFKRGQRLAQIRDWV